MAGRALEIAHRQLRFVMLLVSPLAFALMVLVGLHLFSGTSWFREIVQSQLSEAFRGDWTIRQVRLGLLLRRVEVRGVQLVDGYGTRVFTVDQVDVKLKPSALLQQRLQIERVDLRGVDVALDFASNDVFNLTDALYTGPAQEPDPEAAPGPPLIIEIHQVRIHKAKVGLFFGIFKVLFEGVDIDWFDLDLEDEIVMRVDRLRIPRGTVEFTPEMFGFSSHPTPSPVPDEGPIPAKEPLRVDVKGLEVERWAWRGLAFDVGRVSFEGSGARFDIRDGHMDFSSPEGFGYNGAMELDLPPEHVGITWFAGPIVQSPLKLQTTVDGFLGAEMVDNSFIDLRLHLRAEALKVVGFTFDQGWLDVRLVNRHLYLEDLVLQGYGGEIALAPSARGGLPPWLVSRAEPPAAPQYAYLSLLDTEYNMPLVIRDLQLAQVIGQVAPTLDADVLEALDGRLSAELKAWGRLAELRDPVRYEALPPFHRAHIEELRLQRPAALAASRRGLAPVQRVALKGDVAFEDGRVRLDAPLEIQLDGDRVRLDTFQMDVSDPALPVEAELGVTIGDAGRWARFYGVQGVRGRVDLGVRADGPLLNPTLSNGRLQLKGGGYDTVALNQASVSFGLSDGTLRLAAVRASGDVGSLEASGSVRLFQGGFDQPLANPVFNLDAPRADVNVGALLGALGVDVPVSGRVELWDGHLEGTPARPVISGNLKATEVSAFGESLDELELSASVRDNRIEVPKLVMRKGEQGRLSLRASFDADQWLSLRLELRDLRAEQFETARQIGIDGTVRLLALGIDGVIDLKGLERRAEQLKRAGRPMDVKELGSWLATQRLDIQGSAALWDLAYQKQRAGNVMLVWDTLQAVGGRLVGTELPPPDAPALTRQAAVRGLGELRLSLEGIWQPVVSSNAGRIIDPEWRELLQERSVADLPDLRGYVHPMHPALVDLSVRVPMSADASAIEGRINFRQLDVRGILTTVLEPYLETQRQGQLRAMGLERTALQLLKAPRRRLQRAKLPLEEALSIWRSLQLTGSAEVFFDRETFEYGAYAAIDQLVVEVFDRRLTNDTPILAGYDGNKLNIDLSLGANRKFVRLVGDLTTQTVGLKLTGFLDLRLLNFLPTVFTDMQGVAQVELGMKGLWTSARPEGFVRFLDSKGDQLSFRLRALGQTVTVERGVVTIEDNVVQISEDAPLVLRIFDGVGRVTGSLVLKDDYAPGAAQVTLSSRNMLFSVPGTMSLTFNTDLRLTMGDLGDPSTWLLADARSPDRPGVQLVSGKFTRDIYFLEQQALGRLFSAFGAGRTARFEESVFEALGPFKDVGLDLTVVGRDSFLVQNEVETLKVDIELKTYARLQETIGQLDLSGSTLEIIPGGTVRYQGEDFKIQQGVVAWKDEVTNPEVDIIIEVDIPNTCGGSTNRGLGGGLDDLSASATQLQTYHILVKLQGELDNLKQPELTSSPYADERDILTLIATGCTTDQLAGSFGGVSGAAVGLALRPWVGKLEDWLTQVIPVDELSIDSDGREARVGVQKRLSERVLFNCAFRQGEDTAHQCGLQVIFRDNLFLEFSERNEGNEFKLDGKLKLRIPLD